MGDHDLLDEAINEFVANPILQLDIIDAALADFELNLQIYDVRNVRRLLRTGLDIPLHDRGSFEVPIAGTLLYCTTRCGQGTVGINAASVFNKRTVFQTSLRSSAGEQGGADGATDRKRYVKNY